MADVTTSNNIFFGTIGAQLMAPNGRLRPYVNAAVGFSYFSTQSSVEGTGSTQPFANSENFSDGGFTTTWGGGLYIPIGHTDDGTPFADVDEHPVREVGGDAHVVDPRDAAQDVLGRRRVDQEDRVPHHCVDDLLNEFSDVCSSHISIRCLVCLKWPRRQKQIYLARAFAGVAVIFVVTCCCRMVSTVLTSQ